MPGEKGSRYVYASSQISNILSKIQNTGRPDKLTLTYIQKTWLLKNAQYGAVIDIASSQTNTNIKANLVFI